MQNIIQYIKENYKLVIGTLVVGLLFGWVLFHSSEPSTHSATNGHEGHNHAEAEPSVWTCSMHPQIKQDKPGLCPICAMDLIPLTSMQSGGDDVDPNEIVMTESAAKLAAVQTLIVSKGTPHKSIYMQGKVQADERNISELTARFGGRIEKLFINFTGQNVRKGQKLATIYSPGLVTAQRELLEAISFKESRPSLYAAARGKLKLWDLTDQQIDNIEQKGEPEVYFDVLSPISGTVSMRYVAIGDYVKEGMPLFKVVDLTKVWVLFDAYERDLPWIKSGDKIDFTIQALPGKNFTANVSYIDPFLNAKTRVAKVRVEVKNPQLALKPEMFSTGLLESKIAESSDEILIPKSAILWTGKRSVVYIKVPNRETPSFLYREVVLGPEAGAFFIVSEGLSAGEEIATNGVFKIDAAAQLIGLPSMMNPAGGGGSTGHHHGDMESPMGQTHGEHASVKVAGNCGMCKDRIEKAAKSVAGVSSASWEAETQTLHLNFDPQKTNVDAIQKAVAEAGHDTETHKTPNAIYEELHGCCQYERLEDTQSVKAQTEHASVVVAGNCGMCKSRIEEAAKSVKGVTSANWDAGDQLLHLNFDAQKTSIDAIQKAIADVGHDTQDHKADDAVYNELPGCCQFDRLKY